MLFRKPEPEMEEQADSQDENDHSEGNKALSPTIHEELHQVSSQKAESSLPRAWTAKCCPCWHIFPWLLLRAGQEDQQDLTASHYIFG